MIIYIDLVIFLNFIFDYFLMITTGIVLKRKINKLRIIISCFIGEFSILLLILNYNYIILIIFKLLLAVFMLYVSYGYYNMKYLLTNISYFYMLSIILGGFFFFLKVNNINYYVSVLLVPLIMLLYIYQNKVLKINYKNYYLVKIVFKNNKEIDITGYLDTGNKLVDPITNKPVIILDKRVAKGVIQIRTPIYVPYSALNSNGLIKCISPKYIIIDKHKITNVLIGLMDNKINIDGVGCILNQKIWED